MIDCSFWYWERSDRLLVRLYIFLIFIEDEYQILRVFSSVPLAFVWLLMTFDCVTCKNLILFVNCIGYADITCNHRQILDYRIIAIFINFSRINWLESKLYVFIILLWYTLVVLCYRYWLQSDISSSNHWYIYITSVSVSNDITVSISCNRWNVYRI